MMLKRNALCRGYVFPYWSELQVNAIFLVSEFSFLMRMNQRASTESGLSKANYASGGSIGVSRMNHVSQFEGNTSKKSDL
jgi:hypothetical protein